MLDTVFSVGRFMMRNASKVDSHHAMRMNEDRHQTVTRIFRPFPAILFLSASGEAQVNSRGYNNASSLVP